MHTAHRRTVLTQPTSSLTTNISHTCLQSCDIPTTGPSHNSYTLRFYSTGTPSTTQWRRVTQDEPISAHQPNNSTRNVPKMKIFPIRAKNSLLDTSGVFCHSCSRVDHHTIGMGFKERRIRVVYKIQTSCEMNLQKNFMFECSHWQITWDHFM